MPRCLRTPVTAKRSHRRTIPVLLLSLLLGLVPACGRALPDAAPTAGAATGGIAPPPPDRPGPERPTLARFMTSLPQHRVIHGWGQGLGWWGSDSAPYFAALDGAPVVVSGYVALGDVLSRSDRLTQIQTFYSGWTDPRSGQRRHFIPLLGVSLAPGTAAQRRQAVSERMMAEMGLEPEPGRPRRGAGGGALVRLSQPGVWDRVRARLGAKGYDLTGLEDLPELARGDRAAAEERLDGLRQQVLAHVRDQLRDEGYPFADLAVLQGRYDREIDALGRAIGGIPSPVLVRFLYETVHGIHSDLIYSPETFRQAWVHFATRLRQAGATNAELVFHPNEGRAEVLERWYPGDGTVDWVGCSLFNPDVDIARCGAAADWAGRHGKPFAICESSPTAPRFRPRGTATPGVWEAWFAPTFDLVEGNANVRLFVYINIDWGRGRGEFTDWGDTRVQSSAGVLSRFQAELAKPIFLPNVELWRDLAAERPERSP